MSAPEKSPQRHVPRTREEIIGELAKLDELGPKNWPVLSAEKANHLVWRLATEASLDVRDSLGQILEKLGQIVELNRGILRELQGRPESKK